MMWTIIFTVIITCTGGVIERPRGVPPSSVLLLKLYVLMILEHMSPGI